MSSKDSNEGKKIRSTNFSFLEKELLLKYAIEYKHILENKESNAVSRKENNKCWSTISEYYNSTTTGCHRDASSLRLKYECIKKLLRGSKSELFQTGGGPHKKAHTISSEYEQELFNIIQLSVEGLPCVFDSDDPGVDNENIEQYETSSSNNIIVLSIADDEVIDNDAISNYPSTSAVNNQQAKQATCSTIDEIKILDSLCSQPQNF